MSNRVYSTATEEDVETLSKPMIGSNHPGGFRTIDYDRFKAKFGVTPKVCSMVWNLVVSNLNQRPRIQGFNRLNPVHILYALFFMKCYPTSRQAVGALGQIIGQNQFRIYSQFVIRQIASLKSQVVINKNK